MNTVGHAGRPKSIADFQTHTTPVPLAAEDREDKYTFGFRFV